LKEGPPLPLHLSELKNNFDHIDHNVESSSSVFPMLAYADPTQQAKANAIRNFLIGLENNESASDSPSSHSNSTTNGLSSSPPGSLDLYQLGATAREHEFLYDEGFNSESNLSSPLTSHFTATTTSTTNTTNTTNTTATVPSNGSNHLTIPIDKPNTAISTTTSTLSPNTNTSTLSSVSSEFPTPDSFQEIMTLRQSPQLDSFPDMLTFQPSPIVAANVLQVNGLIQSHVDSHSLGSTTTSDNIIIYPDPMAIVQPLPSISIQTTSSSSIILPTNHRPLHTSHSAVDIPSTHRNNSITDGINYIRPRSSSSTVRPKSILKVTDSPQRPASAPHFIDSNNHISTVGSEHGMNAYPKLVKRSSIQWDERVFVHETHCSQDYNRKPDDEVTPVKPEELPYLYGNAIDNTIPLPGENIISELGSYITGQNKGLDCMNGNHSNNHSSNGHGNITSSKVIELVKKAFARKQNI